MKKVLLSLVLLTLLSNSAIADITLTIWNASDHAIFAVWRTNFGGCWGTFDSAVTPGTAIPFDILNNTNTDGYPYVCVWDKLNPGDNIYFTLKTGLYTGPMMVTAVSFDGSNLAMHSYHTEDCNGGSKYKYTDNDKTHGSSSKASDYSGSACNKI